MPPCVAEGLASPAEASWPPPVASPLTRRVLTLPMATISSHPSLLPVQLTTSAITPPLVIPRQVSISIEPLRTDCESEDRTLSPP